MKNTWKVAVTVAAAALIGTAGSARADLNLNGETGMFIYPSAQIVQKDHGEIGVNYFRIASGGGEHLDQYGIVGAAAVADRLELNGGIGREKFSGGEDEELGSYSVSGFGLKYQLQNAAKHGYDLAIGVEHATSFVEISDTDAYLVGTKAFATGKRHEPILATLGLRYDHLDEFITDSENQLSVYAGAEVPLTHGLNLVGEIGTKTFDIDGAKAPYSLGLRYSPKDKSFSVSGGIQRSGLGTIEGFGGTSNSNFFLQAGYTFGK